ncbi:MAG TPA: hypothetical protein VFV20_02510, partial [Candidatus Limnocylindria bacterium]|nr:hypothetical protein [Candidatus Limnocylindria bacterium]
MVELDALGRRIERIALEPETVRAPWTRLIRPILRTIGWRPAFEADALRALLDELRRRARTSDRSNGAPAREPDERSRLELTRLADEAVKELETNVVSAERACVVDGGVPVAYAAWLRRLFEVVVRAVRAARPERFDPAEARVAASIDRIMLLPPLAVAHAAENPAAASGAEANPSPPATIEERTGSRLVELQLAAIDHLIDAARDEPQFLARRRRLLEAARQMLLDTSAALPLDPAGVEARRSYLAAQIVRIDRLQAAGISPDVAVLHQARAALASGDRQRLHATLVAMEGGALATGDAAVASRVSEALVRLGGADRESKDVKAKSLARSQRELLGGEVVGAVKRAYRNARDRLTPGVTPDEREISELARKYLAPGAELATLPLVLASDGCFEVGGTLSPVRVTEHHVRARAVSYPTQDLVLLPARDPSDIPGAVIEDPRTVLTSLAEGRLLTRKYVRYERVPRERTRMVGEVRV